MKGVFRRIPLCTFIMEGVLIAALENRGVEHADSLISVTRLFHFAGNWTG